MQRTDNIIGEGSAEHGAGQTVELQDIADGLLMTGDQIL